MLHNIHDSFKQKVNLDGLKLSATVSILYNPFKVVGPCYKI